MWNLDAYTLVIVETFTLFLVGVLLLLAALQGRHDRTLLWASASMALAGAGFAVGILRTISLYSGWVDFAVVLSNMLLVTGQGCLWISLRAFAGRPVRWVWMLAGAIAWFLLCQWPWFLSHVNARIIGFCLLSLVYYVLAAREIWPERRRVTGSAVLVLCVLSGHGLYYVYRMANSVQSLGVELPWVGGADFTLTIFESIVFVVSVSFGILIMVRERTERQYRHASLHDALTSLPNRRALFERGSMLATQTRDNSRDLAVLMCDLDYFKRINDEHGHEAGDRLLVLFAQVLRGSVAANALCARMGGEEFIVMAPDMGPREATELATRIRRNLARESSKMTGCVSVSIGISGATTAGYDLDQLLIRADHALYQAKASGRDCARLWFADTEVEPPAVPVARTRS